VVVDLAAADDGDALVEQRDQRTQQARLGLAALAEEDDVLAGEDGVLQLRDDAVVVAADAGEEGLAGGELADQVAAQLGLDGLDAVLGLAELAEGLGEGCHGVLETWRCRLPGPAVPTRPGTSA